MRISSSTYVFFKTTVQSYILKHSLIDPTLVFYLQLYAVLHNVDKSTAFYSVGCRPLCTQKPTLS